ncbi:high nitrogen upregulated cytochrome P450 monooxygenase 2 [Schizopora paradoxa]|uniref:High nitrogen upregulated cytochrome P450 monooxygenase 2 n=1 Tax=Schizopora paradoxa TaxID=27342 RepID=A0A0H2S819_9AGAM|nr:high nitrogen upregulated cytochrome P450 monooxygenase 2 [Schizopora paradoxa]
MFTLPQRMNITQRECVALIVSWALITHLYFRKYTFAPPHVFYTLGYLLVSPSLLSIPCIYAFSSVWRSLLISYTLSFVSLLAITVLYRIAPFHPLGNYPGPILARVSKFWAFWVAKGGKQHLVYKSLHETYGPIVRVGPNELSIINVEAIPVIFGEGMGKGHIWEARRPPVEPIALPGIRDPHRHALRRRAWNKALSSSSIKEFEPLIIRRIHQLVECLEGDAKNVVDLSYWFSCYTLDFMGDMMFGGGFELMRDGDKDGLKRFMASGIKNLALLHTIPWAARITWRIPAVAGRIIRLRDWSVKYAQRRKDSGSSVKDVFHYLINEDSDEGYTPDDLVVTDSLVAIVAGSDSTATVLSAIFYYLMMNITALEKLRAEINATIPFHGTLDSLTLANMPYLNAVINEGLRLQPPLPIAIQRSPLAGTGGKVIGTQFIPEGTAVNIPPYVMHRDSRYFSPSPDSFIPERWLREGADCKKYVTNVDAFVPFAGGFAGCVGKNLAILNLRMVIVVLVRKFDMVFADDYDSAKWEEELEEWFVFKTGKLPVVLTPKI